MGKKMLVLNHSGFSSLNVLLDSVLNVLPEEYEVDIRRPSKEHLRWGMNETEVLTGLGVFFSTLKNYNLVEFDIIFLSIYGLSRLVENPYIPKNVIIEMKNLVAIAEQEKKSPIRLICGNSGLSGDKLQEQIELFDGLFIGNAPLSFVDISKILGVKYTE